ncbi:MAG: DUF4179 domain-containing protein [Paraclostridium sp.]
MKDNFFDQIDVSTELDNVIESSVKVAVLKKRRRNIKIVSLCITVFIFSNMFFLNDTSFAGVKDFFIGIASYFGTSDNLNDYKASIGTSVSDGGYTITINEALVNENELIISSTIKSDNGPILGEVNFYPTILINNKELSYDSDEMLERKDNSTINCISTYRFNEKFTGDVNVEIQYKPFKTSENSEVNKVEGSWNFAFDINADELKETSTVVELDKVLTLDPGVVIEFTEFKSNAFNNLIKTSVAGDISKFEVKLIGLDDLGNKYEFIVNKLSLDEKFNGTVIFELDTENSKKIINASTLTLYPYLRNLGSNKDFNRVDDEIYINLK